MNIGLDITTSYIIAILENSIDLMERNFIINPGLLKGGTEIYFFR